MVRPVTAIGETQWRVPEEANQGRATAVPLWLIALLVVVVAVGVVMRVPGIDEPPLAFHTPRQYHSALIARSYHLHLGADYPSGQHAAIHQAAPEELEPPVMEAVAAVVYRVSGGVRLWVPRVISIAVWAAAAVAVFAVLRRLASPAAGLLGAAVLTFLPYGIEAGRSFQPEPLMVATVMGAVLTAVRYAEERTPRRFRVAVAVGAVAVLVKLPAAFFVVPVFAGLHLHGTRHSEQRPWHAAVMYTAGVVSPALVWLALGFGVLGFLEGQTGGRIVPQLIGDPEFWRAWGRTLDAVVSWPLAAVGVGGGLMLGGTRGRVVVGALLGGYVLHGLVFTYHYATHDYYHLMLLPIVGLGLGLAAHGLVASATRERRRTVTLASTALVVVLAIAASDARRTMSASAVHRNVDVAREVGATVEHSADILFLAPSDGNPLQFHGRVAGRRWPSTFDLFAERFRREDSPQASERLGRLVAEEQPQFFVVTDLEQWRRQPELQRLLTSRYPVAARGDGYLVFDMRR